MITKNLLVETILQRILNEELTAPQKVAVVQIEHKPTKKFFYSYTTEPANYIKYVLKYREKEGIQNKKGSISDILRKDNNPSNWKLYIAAVFDDLETAIETAKRYNKRNNITYQPKRRPEIENVPVIVINKNDSKFLNDTVYVKSGVLNQPQYKDLKVDKLNSVRVAGIEYYPILSLNYIRK
jgi:hypothetical protein